MSDYKFKRGDMVVRLDNPSYVLIIRDSGSFHNKYSYCYPETPSQVIPFGDKEYIESAFRLITKLDKALK